MDNVCDTLFLKPNGTAMRKLFFSALLLFITTGSFCQQTNFHQSLTKQDYLEKSKKQKTAAWVMLGGGFALAAGGAVLDVSSDWNKSETPYLVAISIGCASMVGSIPLFIASGKNKRKAINAAAFFEIRQHPVTTNTGFSSHVTPTLSLKLNF
jgi:hypothetical protein